MAATCTTDFGGVVFSGETIGEAIAAAILHTSVEKALSGDALFYSAGCACGSIFALADDLDLVKLLGRTVQAITVASCITRYVTAPFGLSDMQWRLLSLIPMVLPTILAIASRVTLSPKIERMEEAFGTTLSVAAVSLQTVCLIITFAWQYDARNFGFAVRFFNAMFLIPTIFSLVRPYLHLDAQEAQ